MLNNTLVINQTKCLRLIILVSFMGMGMNVYSDGNYDTLIVKNKTFGSNIFTSKTYNPGIVKHIVIFKYKDSVTMEQKKDIIQRFLNLKQSRRPGEKDPYIISITTGSQSSGEKVSLGFEQAFIVTFQSEGDRNYYVGTPVVDDPVHYDKQHADFKKFVGPLLAENNGVLVF